MRICYFGQFDPNYPRNSIIRQGLISLGIEIITCQVGYEVRKHFSKNSELLKQFLPISRSVDAVIVAEINFAVMPLAKALASFFKLPLIFDPFISRYDTFVLDRQKISAGSGRAHFLYWTDRWTMNLADCVLADTRQHLLYFQDKFRVYRPISVVPIGADDQIFYPRPTENEESGKIFRVVFWGSYIPLHGMQYIIRAAHILQQQREQVQFNIAGMGQTFAETQQLVERLDLSNVTLLGYIPTNQLLSEIQQADIVLGTFGGTKKARRTVQNKIFEGVAMAKALITGDCPALREFFIPGKHLHAVPMADPHALAEAIIYLARNKEYRHHLAKCGYEHFLTHFTPESVGLCMKNVLEQLV